jgi:hypothetical protein
MTLGQHRRAVGVFPTRNDAEHALNELRDSGFAMTQVSVVARDAERNEDIAGADVRDRVGTKAEEGAGIGALTGGGLGGLTGLLVGLGALAIPGIGPVMLAGATATTIATTLAGSAIGAVAGSLVGALVGLGIPEERARVYNERVSRGEYLVILDGTDAEIARAEAILKGRGIQEYGIYNAPNGELAAPVTTTPTPVVASTASIGRNKYAIGYFPHRQNAEQAIAALRSAGFPLGQVSLVAERFERREPFAGLDLRDRLDAIRMGLPDDRARFYNDRLTRGDYLVVVNGTEEEAHRATSILSNHGIQEWRIYDPTEVGTTHRDIDRRDETPGVAAAAAGYVNPTRSDYDVMPGGASTAAGYVAPVTTDDVVNRNDTPVISSATTGYAAPTPIGQSDVNIGGHKRAAGVFLYRRDAEAALTELRDSGFPMAQVSVVARDADHQAPLAGAEMHEPTGNKAGVVGNKADEGAKGGAVTGGALGGIGGLLVGLGALAIPGVGPIVLAGAGATALATAAAGGAIGAAAGGLTGGLVGLGIPENRARLYSDRINKGEYVVFVDGTDDEVRRAEAILRRRGIEEFETFDLPDNFTTTPAIDGIGATPLGYAVTPDPISGIGSAPIGYTPIPETTGIDRPLQTIKRAIGAFPHHRDAEAALAELRDSGFPMNQVSLIAKDVDGSDHIGGVDRNVPTGNKADKGAAAGAATGGALGGLGGLLVGLGTLAIPGIGPVMAGGAVATAIATAITGGAIGAAAGGLTGGLVGLGIPENRAKVYSDRINRGEYVVFVDGTDDEVRRAETILKRRGIQEFEIFDIGRDHVAHPTSTDYSTLVSPDSPPVIVIDNRDRTV